MRIEEIGRKGTRVIPCWGLALLIAVFLGNATGSLGQAIGGEKNLVAANTGSSGNPAVPPNDPAPQSANALVLQELERMRARIEQLEAELKQRDAAEQPATEVHTAEASPPAAISLGASGRFTPPVKPRLCCLLRRKP